MSKWNNILRIHNSVTLHVEESVRSELKWVVPQLFAPVDTVDVYSAQGVLS